MTTVETTPTEYLAEAYISRRNHWEKFLFRVDVQHLQVGDLVMTDLLMSEVPIAGPKVPVNCVPRKIRKIKTNEQFSTVSVQVRHYLFPYWHTFLHPEEQVFVDATNTRGRLLR